jgi:flagellar motility protein MotE (MotC chaperone)
VTLNLRAVRLLPIAIVAIGSLLLLKLAGLTVGGGYVFGTGGARAQTEALPPAPWIAPVPKAAAKRSWAQEMLGYPEITGSVPTGKPVHPAAQNSAGGKDGKAPSPPLPEGKTLPLDDKPAMPAGERAVLERLQERRQELEGRARELEIREGLLKAAEKRIETRIGELKILEAQVNAALQKKDEGEAARFKSLVSMYENMKAKDAARIFDRLEQRVLLEVATQVNPRRMSDILAQMSPEAAERLTVELANRSGAVARVNPADLPKIEGKPRT